MQEYDYFCTGCGRDMPRDSLTAKKVQFAEMGKYARTIRSRVTDWLCQDCVEKDPAWQIEPNQTPTQRMKETHGTLVSPRKSSI